VGAADERVANYPTNAPDLCLLLGPRDEAYFVCQATKVTKTRGAVESMIYVVIHRAHDAWTCVYRIVDDGRPGWLTIYVEQDFRGAQAEQAREWAQATFLSTRADAGTWRDRLVWRHEF
jgi:hypothetical protein